MRRIATPLAVGFLLAASFALAQTAPAPPGKVAAAAPAAPDKALLAKILTAWETMNPDNVAKYYDQAPGRVFYDVAPLKYEGFKQYADGVKQMFATLSSIKFTLNDDAAMHSAGNFAWGTVTVKSAMTDKAGKTTNFDGRWTTIWQRKGTTWVIVHDHFSAPLPDSTQ